jgi:hypothetical protein
LIISSHPSIDCFNLPWASCTLLSVVLHKSYERRGGRGGEGRRRGRGEVEEREGEEGGRRGEGRRRGRGKEERGRRRERGERRGERRRRRESRESERVAYDCPLICFLDHAEEPLSLLQVQ